MNLPYLIDGEVAVSQTVSILQYLGRKGGLYGSTVEDACKIEQVLAEAQDLRNKCVDFFYGRSGDSTNQAERLKFLEGLRDNYDKFETWLAQHGTLYTVAA